MEKDHRSIYRRTRTKLGFKPFASAPSILAGIEVSQMIRKGQFTQRICLFLQFAGFTA